MKKKILFICTQNSVRSQMAEGIVNSKYRDSYEAYSAGTKPSKLNPYAIEVMKEIDIDISKQHSKNLDDFVGKKFDYVVTVCDSTKGSCPLFPGGEIIHKEFYNPSDFVGTEEEKLEIFRKIRDEIREWIEKTFTKQIVR